VPLGSTQTILSLVSALSLTISLGSKGGNSDNNSQFAGEFLQIFDVYIRIGVYFPSSLEGEAILLMPSLAWVLFGILVLLKEASIA
jgi:hypothetical protein